MSTSFLVMWTLGEILTLIYVAGEHGLDRPLMFNYCMNLLVLIVLWRYRLCPRLTDASLEVAARVLETHDRGQVA